MSFLLFLHFFRSVRSRFSMANCLPDIGKFSPSPLPPSVPPFLLFWVVWRRRRHIPPIPHPPSLPVPFPSPLLLKGNIFSVEFIAEGRLLFPTHTLSPPPTRKARSALFFSLVRAFSPDPPSPPSVGSLVREGISVASVPSPSIPHPTSSQAYLFTRPRKEGGDHLRRFFSPVHSTLSHSA